MPTITVEQLKEMLKARKGATIVTIVAETEPDLRKTGNPYIGCKKISRVNGVINWIYENAVNRQREREGQPVNADGYIEHFESLPRKWGQRIHGTPFVEHKDNTYLELKVERSLGHEYRHNGETLTDEQVAPFLPKKKEGERQKVDKPVILRDYNLTNIVQISVGGEVYDIAK